jgi:hypothetical protein
VAHVHAHLTNPSSLARVSGEKKKSFRIFPKKQKMVPGIELRNFRNFQINLGAGPSKMCVVSRLDPRISAVGDPDYGDPLLKQQAFEKKNDSIYDTPIPSTSHTHPSHSQTSRLLTLSLSLGVPVPRGTQCM